MYRTYNHLKLNRSYIGNSKKKETKKFDEVQGNGNDDNCDWIEYRRMLIQYFEDTIHVIFSWKIIAERTSIILMLFSIILLQLNILFSFLTITLSVIAILTSLILKNKLNKWTSMFEFSIGFVNGEVKKRNGFSLPEFE